MKNKSKKIKMLKKIVGNSNGTNWEEFDNDSHKIIDCANYWAIKSTGEYAGGMVGYFKGNILNCCNKGTITGGKTSGGIVGTMCGSVENCYNFCIGNNFFKIDNVYPVLIQILWELENVKILKK